MEATILIIAFVALAALALRFGQDSREGFLSKERELAAYGKTWLDLAQEKFASAAPSAVLASPTLVVESPVAKRESKQQYPTLAFIEAALGDAIQPLTTAPDAWLLEARARELVAEYWPDTVWTTGIVPAAAFRRLLVELAPDAFEASVGVGAKPTAITPVRRAPVEPTVVVADTDSSRQAVIKTAAEPYAAV